MKQFILFFTTLLSSIPLFSQSPNCSLTITGNVKGDSIQLLYSIFPSQDLNVEYARKGSDGVLKFSPSIIADNYFVLLSTDSKNINLFLNRNENLTINIKDDNSYTISGTKAYETYDKIRLSLPEDAAKREEEVMIRFSKQYDTDEVPLLLLFFIGNEDNFIDVYNRMPSEIKSGRYKNALDFQLSMMSQVSNKKKMIGTEAIDFTLLDSKGNKQSLNDYRGKYVILDFWASWCGWCISDMSEMRKYYDKYSTKMEIIGLNLEDKEAIWRNSVVNNRMNWVQVQDKNGEVKQLYNVKMLPSKVVISPEGKILKFVDGADPVFYDYLNELFKE